MTQLTDWYVRQYACKAIYVSETKLCVASTFLFKEKDVDVFYEYRDIPDSQKHLNQVQTSTFPW